MKTNEKTATTKSAEDNGNTENKKIATTKNAEENGGAENKTSHPCISTNLKEPWRLEFPQILGQLSN